MASNGISFIRCSLKIWHYFHKLKDTVTLSQSYFIVLRQKVSYRSLILIVCDEMKQTDSTARLYVGE